MEQPCVTSRDNFARECASNAPNPTPDMGPVHPTTVAVGVRQYPAGMVAVPRVRIAVSDAALDAAAQTLRDKFDILLDRITDRLLDMPRPGTPDWYAVFRDHSSTDTYRQQRRDVRATLAHRAGVDFAADIPVIPVRHRRRSTRRRVDDAQLSIW